MKIWISTILGLTLAAADVSAQLSPVVSVGAEQGSIQTGYYAERPRRGLALGLGSVEPDGTVRLVLGIFPQGDVEPGWTTISVEMGPRFTLARGLSVGAQGTIGGFDMNVGNRHRAIQGCRPEIGCMFEGPTFEEGWGMVGGAVVTGSLEVFTRVSVIGGHRWSWIFAGANKGESLQGWSFGLQYRFR